MLVVLYKAGPAHCIDIGQHSASYLLARRRTALGMHLYTLNDPIWGTTKVLQCRGSVNHVSVSILGPVVLTILGSPGASKRTGVVVRSAGWLLTRPPLPTHASAHRRSMLADVKADSVPMDPTLFISPLLGPSCRPLSRRSP